MRLLQRRHALLARYRDEIDRAEQELAARDVEAVARATEEWDVRVLSSLGDHDLKSIVAINEALARLDRDGYGACSQCGEPIADARLDAVPESTTCVDCASSGERNLPRSA